MKAIVCSLLLIAPLANAAELSPIRLQVEQVSKDNHSTFTHKQGKSLKIELSNSSLADVSGLKVKYVYFARNVKTNDVVALGEGEMAAAVKAHGSVTIEAPGVSVSYTEKHVEGNPFKNSGKGGKGGKGGKNSGKVNVKTVAESGQRYVGYRVQVFSGGVPIAEYFSEPSLKAKPGN